MKLYDDEMKTLAAAIVKQAVEDYRALREKNAERDGVRCSGTYSRKEIEEFFKGDLCQAILEIGLKSDLIGMDFLRAAT